MNGTEKLYLPTPEDFSCFACGMANPIGLKMRFYVTGPDICSDITLAPEHAGWERIAHGGIISTLLDEVMSYAMVAQVRQFFVTRRMTVDYRRPVPLGEPLLVRGRVTGPSEKNERDWETSAELIGTDGKALARATGVMTVLGADQVPFIPETLRVEMERLFAASGELLKA